MKQALIIYGGWDGHEPGPCAAITEEILKNNGFQVELETTFDVLMDTSKLQNVDLFVPVWTMGAIAPEQTQSLIAAVQAGLGIAGFHGGMCDAFHGNEAYQFMTGGQFVAHPDNIKSYTVNIVDPEDPIVNGIDDFEYTSEQYYMLVDPGVQTLATTTFETQSMPWLNGCVMPTIWKRQWGDGKVFYSALGHCAAEFKAYPQMVEILKRGMLWAAR